MCKKVVIIDGSKFDDIEGFYSEIDRVLTKDLTWITGHNLNAFNDLLYGGFGVHEYDESIIIIWGNASKSKSDLGYHATVKYYEKMLRKCHPTNIDKTKKLLEDSKRGEGDTFFDIVIEIIKNHDHIELIFDENIGVTSLP